MQFTIGERTMSVVIRKMRVEDLSEVKRIDGLAWDDLRARFYPDIIKIAPRTDQNLLSYLRSDPEGAFVAADDFAGIIGSSFSHLYGRTGWAGPVSVLPSYQGRGAGKELLRMSLRYMEARGCTDIGLETMPESQLNIGMYLRVGLRPAGLVLIMGKRLFDAEPPDEVFGEITVERLSESAAKDAVMVEIRRISNALHPGLDYSPEVTLTEEFSLGDTFLATSRGRVVGFCILHTAPTREETPGSAVRVIAVDPAFRDEVVVPLVAIAELAAIDAHSVEISLPVPSVSRRSLDIAFSRGYSVVQSFERMMWLGGPGLGDKAFNLCTWTG